MPLINKYRFRVLLMSFDRYHKGRFTIPKSFHPVYSHEGEDKNRFCIQTKNQNNYFKRIS